jgi:hypothetical protein
MSASATTSKPTKPFFTRFHDEEMQILLVRAAEIQAVEKTPVSVQDVVKRTLFPDRYPARAA